MNSVKNSTFPAAAPPPETLAVQRNIKSDLSPDGVAPVWSKAQIDGEMAKKLPA